MVPLRDEVDAVTRLRRDALAIAQAALAAVHGRVVVAQELRDHAVTAPVHLIAVGKAAAAMANGALDVWGDAIVRGLVITKLGHGEHSLAQRDHFICMKSAHPLPDARSVTAGAALLDFIESTPADAGLLFLISGGASSLVEVLAPGVSLAELQRANAWLLGSGLPIAAINTVRKMLSGIKGGKLLKWLGGRTTLALLISDVQHDDPALIGSGLLSAGADPPSIDTLALPSWLIDLCQRAPRVDTAADAQVETRIVACLADAKRTAAQHAQALGYACHLHAEFLADDAGHTGQALAHGLCTAALAVHIWGGETTVVLPACPGRGGRNQTLALAAALALQDRADCVLLALASDGSDGPGEDAGALVDGGSVARGVLAGCDAQQCLTNADAGTFLEASGDLVHTGPTGTNVMDILIGISTA